jgi:hypothetical protein
MKNKELVGRVACSDEISCVSVLNPQSLVTTQDRLLLSCPLTYFTIRYKNWGLGLDDWAIESGIVPVTKPQSLITNHQSPV